MELKLEIKFANKEELKSVAEALLGLQLSPSVSHSDYSDTDADEMEEVESPFKPQSLVEEPQKDKPLTAKQIKAAKDAEKKALKEAKEKEAQDAKEAQRVAVEEEKKRILASAPQETAPAENVAHPVYEEILQLSDKLMAFQGIAHTDKQAIVNACIAQVQGPKGVRPSTYPVALAVPFKQALEAQVNALYSNPPMSGLV